jgi:hypothetical protein
MNKILLITYFLGCFNETQTPKFPELPSLTISESDITEEKRTTPRTEVKEFSIALIGEVRGELEPCGCPTLPYGGFVRRDRLLQEQKQQSTVFHLDAGELLLKGFYSNKGDDAKKRARLLSSLSKNVGVDAWSIGPTDIMALGIQELISIEGPSRISANLVDSHGDWLFEPYIILQKNNIKIAVIGLTEIPTDPQWALQVTTIPPEQALQKVLPMIPKDVDLIVILGSVDDEKALQLSRSEPKVAAILTTRGASYEAPYHPSGNTNLPLIVESPERGRYIHMLHFRLNGDANQPPVQIFKEQEWRDFLLLQKQQSNNKKETLITQFNREGEGRNLFFGELIPLNESYNGRSIVEKSILEFGEQRVKEAQENANTPSTPSDPGYAASGRCAQCHTKELAKWSFSDHARSWETLLIKNETQNPECITCHTTGFGAPGGFGELTKTNVRKFKGVQCEACHGPLKGHPDDERIKSQKISKEVCLSCHDEANSPQFDYVSYLHKSTCQSFE